MPLTFHLFLPLPFLKSLPSPHSPSNKTRPIQQVQQKPLDGSQSIEYMVLLMLIVNAAFEEHSPIDFEQRAG